MPVRKNGSATETGVLHAGGATLRWTMDGSSLDCSDFEGDPDSFGALADAANALAVVRFAAVLVTRMRSDDPRIEKLRNAGFIDDGEPVAAYVTLVRDVR